MACSVRTNRHGYLCFRLYFHGLESHEGTALKDTPENRLKVERRAEAITDEMESGSFEYLRWFPEGNLADRFRMKAEASDPKPVRVITVRRFFDRWGTDPTAPDEESAGAAKQIRPVSTKWSLNRASYLKTHVVPVFGQKRLDELTIGDLVWLQQRLRRDLAPSTVDRVIHSALRGFLRDAAMVGYDIPDLRALYDGRMLTRLTRAGEDVEVDPFSETERDRIIAGFRKHRAHYLPFVAFRFWTGTRPSEAVALRHGQLDLTGRRARIRASRVLGQDGQTKTGRSKRVVVLHEPLVRILRDRLPTHPAHDDFVFTTPSGTPIDQANFYAREWVPMLRRLKIRPRPFYNTRHSYISYMLAIGARPLWVARQTGTSLEMIEQHYGDARCSSGELDALISDAKRGRTRNLPGTFGDDAANDVTADEESPDESGPSERAGDRGRTGDVQLGKEMKAKVQDFDLSG